MGPVIGVLALQGAFAKHIQMIERLGVAAIEVRKPNELQQCDALVIPGGESTTMMKHLHFIGMVEPLRKFSREKPVFGTCAGLILISANIIADTMQPFKLIDIGVERNAFGRQVESFQTDISVNFPGEKSCPFEAIFIRAPRIRHVEPSVTVLASFEGEPILVKQGHHLGATFHPELTDDPTIHAYFLKLISSR